MGQTTRLAIPSDPTRARNPVTKAYGLALDAGRPECRAPLLDLVGIKRKRRHDGPEFTRIAGIRRRPSQRKRANDSTCELLREGLCGRALDNLSQRAKGVPVVSIRGPWRLS
jgi:hypothetical protein